MSEHYGSLEAATAYHAAYGNAAWSAVGITDAFRTAALVRASAALDGAYGPRFPGRKASRAQVLAWPRIGARDHCASEDVPEDEVPAEIERATYALALAELTSPGVSAPTVTPGRLTKREKVDSIEREFMTAADGGASGAGAMRPVLLAVEDALRCLLAPKGATVFLERV